mgnify:FL=1
MFGKTDKNIEQFRDLTQIMENTPHKTVPDVFTTKVMEKLASQKETSPSFSLRRLFPTSLNVGFQNAVTKTECAFYFLLTAFFYFILGLIMLIELPVPAVLNNNEWISFQPLFGILLALELTAIGIVLYKKGDAAVRYARMGTLLYAALILLNFWIGAIHIQIPAAILFVAIFSITGLGIAFLLGLAIAQYHSGTYFSEVRG